MHKRLIAVTTLALALAVSTIGAAALAGNRVTYRAQRGDGCGPPSQDGFTWASFVVLRDRICGSYPWDAQRMVAGGSVGFYNRTSRSHRLVSYKSANSRRWNLDLTIGGGGVEERRLYRPGLYLFRDRAHSKLVWSNGSRKCLGACGYLRVRY